MDFAKPVLTQSNSDVLNYEIIDTNKDIDYSTPQLYTDCSTPVCLSYVNKDIKTKAIIPNIDTLLNFDGSILRKGTVSLNSIDAKISFNVHIINKLQQHYICNIFVDIPLENSDDSIYDGYILDSKPVNYEFYRVK